MVKEPDRLSGAFSRGVAVVLASWVLAGASLALASSDDIRAAFPNKVVKLQAERGKDAYTVEWAYTNPHDLPMVVEKVDSDCGCLVVEVDGTRPVEKGESGKVTAEFSPGARQGRMWIGLKVRFVGYDQAVDLVLEARIPAPVEASVQELTWTAKSRKQTRTVEVTTGTATDFKITGLTGLPKGFFTIKQETVKEKRHYRLQITPTDKVRPGLQHLQICTDARDPMHQMVEVHLRVQ